MFDRCLEIHKRIGCTGRAGMEVESKKFYSNISRPIIEIFLNTAKNIKLKEKNVNHGLVVKPIVEAYYNQGV